MTGPLATGYGATRRETVLIAEGRSPHSSRLREAVEEAGFLPILTYSGQVALSRARVLKPALVLLSDQIGEPGTSETARRIKEDPATGHIPVVILAATNGAGVMLARTYPVDACLPIDIDGRKLARIVRLLADWSGRSKRVRRRKTWPLEGTVGDGLLLDVLQFLFMSGRRGCVTVSHGGSAGNVYFSGGKLLHAEFPGATGEDAFFEICFLERGSFKFQPDVVPPKVTMRKQGVELLLEACRRLDTDRSQVDDAPQWHSSLPEQVVLRHARIGESVDDMDGGDELRLAPEPEAPPQMVYAPPPRPLEVDSRPKKRAPGLLVGTAVAALVGIAALAILWHLRPGVVMAPGLTFPSEAAPPLPAVVDLGLPVQFRSNPEGASVSIDGRRVGETPLDDVLLFPGRYALVIAKEGWLDLRQDLVIDSEGPVPELHFALRPAPPPGAALNFDVEPRDATVRVDGKPLRGKRRRWPVSPGEHLVEVAADGFKTWREQLTLESGSERTLTVRLEAEVVESAAVPEPAPPVEEPPSAELAVEPPVKISGETPAYPREAFGKRIQGTVEVEIEVDEEGNVASVRVVESAGTLLDPAVVAAVSSWKFQPATRGGEPVTYALRYRHSFRRDR
jgi:TonB family protein